MNHEIPAGDPEGNNTDGSAKDRTVEAGHAATVYELFILGELMADTPQYGYRLYEIAGRVLGPQHSLSWGTLYPLIRRLEGAGLTTAQVEQHRTGFAAKTRGQPRRLYAITEQGQARFFALMLDTGGYSRAYSDLFAVKLSKFHFLTAVQQGIVLRHYQGYLQELQEYYQQGVTQIQRNPGISMEERPAILSLVDYRLTTLRAQAAWVAERIAALPESDPSALNAVDL